MNNIALNISIQVSVWTYISDSYMCIPRSGIAGSYENSVQLFESESEGAQSCQLFATPWACESTKFSRPEYWSG